MGNLREILSLMERMENNERVHSDENFDLDKMPMDLLDKAWKRYHPYEFTIDHDNMLAAPHTISEGTDYRKQINDVKDVITSTFEIPSEHFLIKEGHHGLYSAVLIALTDDNLDIIERHMENQGLFRSQPTDDKLLVDRKNREWLDVRFEPKNPDDITEEIKRKYGILYHLVPKVLESKVEKEGLLVSNSNPMFKYSECRVFLSEGDASNEDIQTLTNTLYAQAKEKKYDNLTPEYTLFKIDLSKLPSDIRFFYDINKKKGIYATKSIPSEYIVDKTYVMANDTDKLPPKK